MYSKYHGIRLQPALQRWETNLSICHYRIYSNKRRSAYLILRATSAALIRVNTVYAHVVHTTAKQVISSRGKNENVCEMCQKLKNARAKRAKLLFFIVKYANLRRSCHCCRRSCFSCLT